MSAEGDSKIFSPVEEEFSFVTDQISAAFRSFAANPSQVIDHYNTPSKVLSASEKHFQLNLSFVMPVIVDYSNTMISLISEVNTITDMSQLNTILHRILFLSDITAFGLNDNPDNEMTDNDNQQLNILMQKFLYNVIFNSKGSLEKIRTAISGYLDGTQSDQSTLIEHLNDINSELITTLKHQYNFLFKGRVSPEGQPLTTDPSEAYTLDDDVYSYLSNFDSSPFLRSLKTQSDDTVIDFTDSINKMMSMMAVLQNADKSSSFSALMGFIEKQSFSSDSVEFISTSQHLEEFFRSSRKVTFEQCKNYIPKEETNLIDEEGNSFVEPPSELEIAFNYAICASYDWENRDYESVLSITRIRQIYSIMFDMLLPRTLVKHRVLFWKRLSGDVREALLTNHSHETEKKKKSIKILRQIGLIAEEEVSNFQSINLEAFSVDDINFNQLLKALTKVGDSIIEASTKINSRASSYTNSLRMLKTGEILQDQNVLPFIGLEYAGLGAIWKTLEIQNVNELDDLSLDSITTKLSKLEKFINHMLDSFSFAYLAAIQTQWARVFSAIRTSISRSLRQNLNLGVLRNTFDSIFEHDTTLTNSDATLLKGLIAKIGLSSRTALSNLKIVKDVFNKENENSGFVEYVKLDAKRVSVELPVHFPDSENNSLFKLASLTASKINEEIEQLTKIDGSIELLSERIKVPNNIEAIKLATASLLESLGSLTDVEQSDKEITFINANDILDSAISTVISLLNSMKDSLITDNTQLGDNNSLQIDPSIVIPSNFLYYTKLLHTHPGNIFANADILRMSSSVNSISALDTSYYIGLLKNEIRSISNLGSCGMLDDMNLRIMYLVKQLGIIKPRVKLYLNNSKNMEIALDQLKLSYSLGIFYHEFNDESRQKTRNKQLESVLNFDDFVYVLNKGKHIDVSTPVEDLFIRGVDLKKTADYTDPAKGFYPQNYPLTAVKSSPNTPVDGRSNKSFVATAWDEVQFVITLVVLLLILAYVLWAIIRKSWKAPFKDIRQIIHERRKTVFVDAAVDELENELVVTPESKKARFSQAASNS